MDSTDRERTGIRTGIGTLLLNERIRFGLAVRLVSGDLEIIEGGVGPVSESLARVGHVAPLTGSPKDG